MFDWSQCTVDVLRVEFKKRGLVVGRKTKDALVDTLHDVIEKESFALFPKFPIEIRQKIFHDALPPRRIVNVKICDGGLFVDCHDLRLVRFIMLSCKDARQAVLVRYGKMPKSMKWNISTPPPFHHSFDWTSAKVNYNDDIFRLKRTFVFGTKLVEFAKNCDFVTKIKTIGVDLIEGVHGFFKDGRTSVNFSSLLKFTDLEEIIVFGTNNSLINNINRADHSAMVKSFNPPRRLPQALAWADNYASPPPAITSDQVLIPWKKAMEDPSFKQLRKVKIYFMEC